MKITVPKLNLFEKIIFLILFLVMFSGVVSIYMPSIKYVEYIIEFLNIFLLLIIFLNFKSTKIRNNNFNSVLLWILSFLIITFFTSVFRSESIILLLWSLRNNFRFFVFFVACVLCLKKNYTGLFDKIYWINFLVVLFEFFILDKKQDWLGGIFGIIGGDVNAPLNLFLVITTARFIVLYLHKKKSLLFFCLTSLCSMIIASMAELKFFYFEYIIIVILAVFVTNFSWRKVKVLICSCLGVIVGMNLLFVVFPGLDRKFFTHDFLTAYTTSSQGYTSSNDINRLNFIEQCNEFFKNGFEQIFGLGLGNCEVFKALGISSNFYMEHYYLHYTWFSSSFCYLETGIVGWILYFGFFIFLFFKIRKIAKKHINIIECNTAQILTLIVPMLLIYNLSMRGNEAYLMYFMLALPFINSYQIENTKNFDNKTN